MSGTYPARLTLAVSLALPVLAASACGSDDEPVTRADGSHTVYSSIPRQGISARQAEAVAAGQRLALADAGGRAGGRRVRLVELDSAGGEDGPWEPDAVEENARRAADDDSAVAYLGELDLGGSAVSVPVTNAAGLLQVSPGDPLPSLTRADPGGGGEGPARYYPEETRSFIRIVPHGGLQAQLLVDWARDRGARSLAIVRDDSVLGKELASWALQAAQRARVPAEVERAPEGREDYEDLARDVAEERPGAVILTSQAGPDTKLAAAALRRAMSGTPLLGTSGLTPDPPAGVDFLDPRLPPEEYGPAARRVLGRLGRSRGGPVGVEALYGYEAMRIVLDAIDRSRARPGDRVAVLRAAGGPRRVDELLGPYTMDPGGDVSRAAFGAYRALEGRPPRAIGVRRPR